MVASATAQEALTKGRFSPTTTAGSYHSNPISKYSYTVTIVISTQSSLLEFRDAKAGVSSISLPLRRRL